MDKLINDMKLVDTYLGPQRLGSYHENEDTSEFQSESRTCVRPTTLYVSYNFYSNFTIFVLFLSSFYCEFSHFCSNFCSNFISFSFFPFGKLNGNIYYVFITCQ